MLSFFKKYAKDEFSQNGEDGFIHEITHRMGIEKGSVVEFGAHNGVYCSNSRALILKGWRGFLIESDPGLYRSLFALYKRPSDIGMNKGGHTIYDVSVLQAFVTPDNVNNIIPQEIDVLSIDVDGIDFHIWQAYRGKAKVVIIEINSSLNPTSSLEGDVMSGSTYSSMWLLGVRKGYILLAHCGNLIFVHKDYADLFPEIAGTDPLQDINEYFNRSWLNQ